jgi:hypothetical protein
MSSLSEFALRIGVVAASILLVAGPGSAAEKDALPPSTPSRQIVPEAASPRSGSSDEPLSDKLQRQDGVLRPPAGIDPEITQKPPAEGKTPVIRPPGTPSGDQGVDPK